MSTTSGNPEPWREGTAPLPTEVPVVPAEVLEAGLDAGLRNGLYAQTSLVEANERFKEELRIFLRAASLVLLAAKEREVVRLQEELGVSSGARGHLASAVLHEQSRVAALEGMLKKSLVRIEILADRMRACNEEPQKHDLSLFEADGWLAEARALLDGGTR